MKNDIEYKYMENFEIVKGVELLEEEINLRELIEVIINGKVVIVAITIVAVLISGIYSFFIISPTYQATTTITVNQHFKMNLETLRTQAKNPEISNSSPIIKYTLSA